MAITVVINFQNQFFEPVETSGTVTIHQDPNYLVCWTTTNKTIHFYNTSVVSFNLPNVGCNIFGCCGDYQITVKTSQGQWSFQITKEYNNRTFYYTITIDQPTNQIISGSEGIADYLTQAGNTLNKVGNDIWILIILIVIIGIILSIAYLVTQLRV